MMKKIFVVLTCMLLCNFAFPQQKPVVGIDTAKRLVFKDPVKSEDRPLIMIDDKEYKGKLENINQDNIESVSVIKTPDAEKLYGKKAVNGVILITTKQPVETEDIHLMPPLRKGINKIILDDKLVEMTDEDIDRLDKLSIEVLKAPQEVRAKRTTVILRITTKAYAIKQYQKKLSTFSSSYKTFINASKGDDKEVQYTIGADGEDFLGSTDQACNKLYKLRDNDIKSVTFYQRQSTESGPKPPMIFITLKATKKY